MQIGQGESLVHFFVSGFAKSPKSGRSSGEKRTGRFIANALFAEVPKSVFGIVVRVSSNEGASGKTAPKWSAPQASSVGRMVDREAKRAEGKGIGYVCASYRKKTTSCTIHFIRTEIVRDLILDALRNVATYARANKEDFEQLVMQTTSDARKRSLQSGRTELDRIMRRTNELDTLL